MIPRFIRSQAGLIALWLAWVAVVGAGFMYIWGYDLTRSPVGLTPSRWPVESQVPFRPGVTNLVLAAHPHCPCTRASFDDLAQILAHADGQLAAHVLVVRPAGTADDWVDTDIVASAAAIPGVVVQRDDGGREAARFGALSSGYVAVYDADGVLRFAGGITAARGHAGDSVGSAAVLAVVEHAEPAQPEAPVFGCSLLDVQPGCPPGAQTCGS